MLLAISSTPGNERGPAYLGQVLVALAQANTRRLPIALEYGQHDDNASLYVRVPASLHATFRSLLAAAYGSACRIERVDDDGLDSPPGRVILSAALRLTPKLTPLVRLSEFEDRVNSTFADPVASILAAVARRPGDPISVRASLLVWPASRRRAGRAHRRLSHAAESDELRTKLQGHLFEARLTISVSAPPELKQPAVARLRQAAGCFAPFTNPRLGTFRLSGICRRFRFLHFLELFSRPLLLSSDEVALLWHPVTASVQSPHIERNRSRELEAPAHLPRRDEADVTLLGKAIVHGRRSLCGLRQLDKLRHIFIVGRSGTGKSTLLQQLFLAEMEAGRGCGIVDPHGDLAASLLACVPKRRTNDVIYFDAADRQAPVAFNPLACPDAEQRALVASGIVSAVHKLNPDSWGPRLEDILRNATLALCEYPGATLVSILRLLTDVTYRKQVVERVSDPVVRDYWQHEFSKWKPQDQARAVASVTNKIRPFASPLLRAIFDQPRSTLDLDRVLDQSQILICNLAKGRCGEDASGFLGSMLVTSLQLASLRRAAIPERDRRPFLLIVDEMHNLATASFATWLSEGRKFALAIGGATQFLSQTSEETLAAIFGNVGTLVSFRVGAKDAEELATHLAGEVTPEDLLNLPNYTCIMQTLVDGVPTQPFTLRTLPPQVVREPGRAEIVRRVSRKQYGRLVKRASPNVAI